MSRAFLVGVGVLGSFALASCQSVYLPPASEIQPYVNLLTWQVLALLAGVIFAPAVYRAAKNFRAKVIKTPLGDFSFEEVERIEQDAEQAVEQKDANAAAQDVDSIRAEAEREPEVAAEEGNNTLAVARRLENALRAWQGIAVIARDKAVPVGGGSGLNQALNNIRLLRDKGFLNEGDVRTAEELQQQRRQFKREPNLLLTSAYRAFATKAGHFASRLEALNPTASAPS